MFFSEIDLPNIASSDKLACLQLHCQEFSFLQLTEIAFHGIAFPEIDFPEIAMPAFISIKMRCLDLNCWKSPGIVLHVIALPGVA